MTKDDDLPAASGRALPKRALASPGRKTAPAGTPVNKLPADIPKAALTPTSSRPPSGAQNTMSPPRTVGGHTARLLRGDAMDDGDFDPPEPVTAARLRVQGRSARGRPLPIEEEDDDDEETIARIAAKVKPPPAGARGGTVRMDTADLPPGEGPPAVTSARRAPPAAPPPPAPDPIGDEPPSTARGGTGRAIPEPAFAPRPMAVAPVALGPVIGPVIATLPVASPPPGEITISGSEFDAAALPPEEVESRWPFAFAVGAVSLAIGSLLPLPFRQYIVRDRGPASSASASASASTSTSTSTSTSASTSASVAGPALLHPTAAPPRTTGPLSPSALPTTLGVAPTASSAARPPAFGSVKVPRPNPTTPKDVF